MPVFRAPARPGPNRFGTTAMFHGSSWASSPAWCSNSAQWSMTRTISSAACEPTEMTACFRSSHLSTEEAQMTTDTVRPSTGRPAAAAAAE